jgi:hypothetical protein
MNQQPKENVYFRQGGIGPNFFPNLGGWGSLDFRQQKRKAEFEKTKNCTLDTKFG